ncbi:ChaN family lipoprotein [Roseovarius aquimarinus]|uniref:ChaN family lipoprotein n=1 Tax=Roseovarius aquimarinus TaxID=1229156 RepID=A0ABW7I973_9RHOB
MIRWLAALALWAAPATAQDVFVMGEVHDNPAHHAVQAERVAQIQPAAIVFEMLTEDQAARVTPELRNDPEALADALGWDQSGWPDFSFYHPIMTAAPEARILGAGIPREAVRGLSETGLAETFGDGAEAFGLAEPLPEAERAAREALQAAAHCDALPPEMLPIMVDIQRLRDAALARAALEAWRETGGPVAVITGNGHARKDSGMPALLARAAPELRIHSLGQGEDSTPPGGGFDEIADSPAPVRGDPCEAFR